MNTFKGNIVGISPKHEELSALSDDELISRYNAAAEHTVVGTAFYREEISRRHLARESNRMLTLTVTMKNLTWVMLLLTVANVLLVLFPLVRS